MDGHDGVVVVDGVLGGVRLEDLIHAEEVASLVGWTCLLFLLAFVCGKDIGESRSGLTGVWRIAVWESFSQTEGGEGMDIAGYYC